MLGSQIHDLFRSARSELLIVAPFVKVKTLERLLENLSCEITIRCVTRWRIDEIVSGVSDLDVWLILRDRPNSELFLCHNLHAKYYRADVAALVGSANVTARALGWSSHPNLELLIPVEVDDFLRNFEKRLFENAIPVDDALYSAIRSAAEQYAASCTSVLSIPSIDRSDSDESGPETSISEVCWIPKSRYPETLYTAYSAKMDSLASASAKAAMDDLAYLQVPLGLTRQAFEACVATELLLNPLVRRLDRFLETPQRFGAVRDWLTRQDCAQESAFDATSAWQTLMRWLLYFWPQRYRHDVPRHSEIFWRISQ